jgi:hypothetical protein
MAWVKPVYDVSAFETASGPANFVCHRAIGEELDAFEARADSECRATNPRGPAILVFRTEEPSDESIA